VGNSELYSVRTPIVTVPKMVTTVDEDDICIQI